MIKLKTLLEDTDQNNNGYPDSTEGNLGRTNVDTYYTKPPTGFQFTNKPIDSQANKLLMNYWDNILNSQEKQQEYQDDRKAGNSNWRDGIELYNRYMLTAGRAENQLKVSGYITPTMRSTNDEGSTNNEFTALLLSLESDLKAYDGEEITYEDDDETMEITVSIYPSELKKEIVQAINVILKKHPLFKIDKNTIDRYLDEDGVTLTFYIIKK
jgi:hypothetical protein